jgi:hypothetical protein
MFFLLKPWQSCFFIQYECQRVQTKNHFDEILSLSFDFKLLKMNNNTLDYQKDLYNKTHLMGKKLKG